MSRPEEDLKKVVSHCKEYGFVFPSSEIYDGLSAVYDYGQNGVELKNNLRTYWWKSMVQMHENIVGIDAAIFMHPTVWKASGHVDGFADPMIDNKDSKKRYRADQLLEDKIERYQKDGKSQKAEELQAAMDKALNENDLAALKSLIEQHEIACPVSGTNYYNLGSDLIALDSLNRLHLMNYRGSDTYSTNSIQLTYYRNDQLIRSAIISGNSKTEVPNQILQINKNRFFVSALHFNSSTPRRYASLFIIDSTLNVVRQKVISLGIYTLQTSYVSKTENGNFLLFGFKQDSEFGMIKSFVFQVDTNLNVLPESSISKSYNYWCGQTVTDSTINISSYTLIDLSNDTFPLGIKKQINPAAKNKTNYVIYPNPGNGDLRVWIEKPGLLKDILVMDVTGRIIQLIPVSQADESLDLRALERGIYFIKALGRQGEIIFTERYFKND